MVETLRGERKSLGMKTVFKVNDFSSVVERLKDRKELRGWRGTQSRELSEFCLDSHSGKTFTFQLETRTRKRKREKAFRRAINCRQQFFNCFPQNALFLSPNPTLPCRVARKRFLSNKAQSLLWILRSL